MKLRIAIIGAGSEEFGPASIHDILLSDFLCGMDLEIALMDINEKRLPAIKAYATSVADTLNRNVKIGSTASLDEALENADFVTTAVEMKRYHFWAMDFHIPRRYGFNQMYGENGGIGGIFHALRNIHATMTIVKKMEEI